MAGKLEGKRIAFLATEGVEQVELTAAARRGPLRGRRGRTSSRSSRGRSRPSTTSTRPTRSTSTSPSPTPTPSDVRRARAAGRRREPGLPARRRGRRRLRARLLRAGQAGGGDLPRPVDARRGRRRPRPHAHVVAVAADRPAQRRRHLGRRGGRRRPGPRDVAQPRRPARRSAPSSSRSSAEGQHEAQRQSVDRPDHGRRRDRSPSSTSTARSSTRTTTTPSRGRGRCARTGQVVPLVDLHRHMGMGGDQLVADVAGEDFDREHGEDARDAREGGVREADRRGRRRSSTRRSWSRALRERGCTVILSSSAKEEEVEHYLELLDVERRPVHDLGRRRADQAGARPHPGGARQGGRRAATAIMVGDSTWDCEAAKRAGVRTLRACSPAASAPTSSREAGAEARVPQARRPDRRPRRAARGRGACQRRGVARRRATVGGRMSAVRPIVPGSRSPADQNRTVVSATSASDAGFRALRGAQTLAFQKRSRQEKRCSRHASARSQRRLPRPGRGPGRRRADRRGGRGGALQPPQARQGARPVLDLGAAGGRDGRSASRRPGSTPGDLDAVAYSYDPALAMAPSDGDLIADEWEGLRTLYAERAPRFLQTALPGPRPGEGPLRRPPRRPRRVGLPARAGMDPCSVLVSDGRGERASHLAGAVRDGALEVLAAPGAAALARPALRGAHRPPRLPPLQRRVQGHGDGVLREAALARRAARARRARRRDGGFRVERRRPLALGARRSPTARSGRRRTPTSPRSVQTRLEEVLLDLARWLHERTGRPRPRDGRRRGAQLRRELAHLARGAVRARVGPARLRGRRDGARRGPVRRPRARRPRRADGRPPRSAAAGASTSWPAGCERAGVAVRAPGRHRRRDRRRARQRRRRRLVPGPQRVRAARARAPLAAGRPAAPGDARADERHQGPRAVPARSRRWCSPSARRRSSTARSRARTCSSCTRSATGGASASRPSCTSTGRPACRPSTAAEEPLVAAMLEAFEAPHRRAGRRQHVAQHRRAGRWSTTRATRWSASAPRRSTRWRSGPSSCAGPERRGAPSRTGERRAA